MLNKSFFAKYFSFVLFILSIIYIGCGEKKEETNNTRQEQVYMNPNDDVISSADTTTGENGDNNEAGQGQNSIVRQGVIDVKAIDNNKDGKVFQCPMDWNVISDRSGSCPVCKMDLEEYSVSKAEDNLVKNDYKVK